MDMTLNCLILTLQMRDWNMKNDACNMNFSKTMLFLMLY